MRPAHHDDELMHRALIMMHRALIMGSSSPHRPHHAQGSHDDELMHRALMMMSSCTGRALTVVRAERAEHVTPVQRAAAEVLHAAHTAAGRHLPLCGSRPTWNGHMAIQPLGLRGPSLI
jgi:hypothetical protein